MYYLSTWIYLDPQTCGALDSWTEAWCEEIKKIRESFKCQTTRRRWPRQSEGPRDCTSTDLNLKDEHSDLIHLLYHTVYIVSTRCATTRLSTHSPGKPGLVIIGSGKTIVHCWPHVFSAEIPNLGQGRGGRGGGISPTYSIVTKSLISLTRAPGRDLQLMSDLSPEG